MGWNNPVNIEYDIITSWFVWPIRTVADSNYDIGGNEHLRRAKAMEQISPVERSLTGKVQFRLPIPLAPNYA